MAIVGLIYDHPRVEEKLIAKELRDKGFQVDMINVNRTPLYIGGASHYDAIIVRTISLYNGIYSAAVYESQGKWVINRSYTLITAGDKILTLSLLASNKVPVVDSMVAVGREAALKAAEIIGYPLVDKPPIGSWGRLVSLVTNARHHEDIIEHRGILGAQFKTHLIQRYIEPGGRDIRCIVVGETLTGCIERIAPKGEWRSNVALGAETKPRKIDGELEEISIKTARIIKGEFISIDILESSQGYLVNEVNGIPEFKGFMKATNKNPATTLATWIKNKL
ncbi:MAG: lysine biosynthesis protein LysX [Desulfurococcales archaeon]|nr:lysine biosynthesis protein LysX [Desulfurococcales archaeon]